MSRTIVDMAKVTQMLDNGWEVRGLFRNELGSYTAIAFHPNGRVRDKLEGKGILDDDGTEEVTTDDFTPEQVLTRLAYKVQGEIISSQPAE